MTIRLVINGVDYTDKTSSITRRMSHDSLESMEVVVDDPSPSDLVLGARVSLLEDGAAVFEGEIRERALSHSGGRPSASARLTAYTDLILYERHVVYRFYSVGTRAGEVIRDLAALEDGVDASGVEDGDALVSPWEIENATALSVMRDAARGTNHLLMMKPGRRLIYRAKRLDESIGTLSGGNVENAEYMEDASQLRNRVIYIGSGGQVLADISEGPGDLPLIINDPFLTERAEAERRAELRLEMAKELGRELVVDVRKEVYDSLGIDIGETLTVDLPSLGISSQGFIVLGVEIHPSVSERTRRLYLGGRREYLEGLISEEIGGDAAARFGRALKRSELTSALSSSLEAASRIQADARTVRLIYAPPIPLIKASNVVLNEEGEAELAAGATSGSLELPCMPESRLFSRWLRVHIEYDPGGGGVAARLRRATGEEIETALPRDYEFPYLPREAGAWTEQSASRWGSTNASLTDSPLAIISYWSVKAESTGGSMEVYYPSSRDAAWDLRPHRYLVIYLYSQSDGAATLRLHGDTSNYLEAGLPVSGGEWRRYTVPIDSMRRVENISFDSASFDALSFSIEGLDASEINWLSILTQLPLLYIDSDYVFQPALREQLTVRIEMTRPTPSAASPKLRRVKFVWREG